MTTPAGGIEPDRKAIALKLCAAYWRDRLPSGEPSASWLTVADAAIAEFRGRASTATASPQPPWKLVPTEPTDAMIRAAVDTPGIRAIDASSQIMQARGYPLDPKHFTEGSPLQQAYRAMLAAAPSEHPTERSALQPEAVGEVRIDAYYVPISKPYGAEIKIRRNRQIEGPDKWSVVLHGDCLNKGGEWEWEPLPSSRDDDFLARCRFDTADQAIRLAILAETQRSGGADGSDKKESQ